MIVLKLDYLGFILVPLIGYVTLSKSLNFITLNFFEFKIEIIIFLSFEKLQRYEACEIFS